MSNMPSVRNSLWRGKQLRVLYFKSPISWDPEHIYKKACRNLNSIYFLSPYITFTWQCCPPSHLNLKATLPLYRELYGNLYEISPYDLLKSHNLSIFLSIKHLSVIKV